MFILCCIDFSFSIHVSLLPPLVICSFDFSTFGVSSRMTRLRSWQNFWRPHTLIQHSVKCRHHWACPMCLYGTLCWPGGGGVRWWFGGSCHFPVLGSLVVSIGFLGCQSCNNSTYFGLAQLHIFLEKFIFDFTLIQSCDSLHSLQVVFWSCGISCAYNSVAVIESFWSAFRFQLMSC